MSGFDDSNFLDAPDDCSCVERMLDDGWRDAADLTQAAHDVIDERLRQQDAEGWTPEGDDRYGAGQLAMAGTAYAQHACHDDERRTFLGAQGITPDQWPDDWARDWFKPKDRRRDLVRAAALLLAEIERLDRLSG